MIRSLPVSIRSLTAAMPDIFGDLFSPLAPRIGKCTQERIVCPARESSTRDSGSAGSHHHSTCSGIASE